MAGNQNSNESLYDRYIVFDIWHDESVKLFKINQSYTFAQLLEKYADFVINTGLMADKNEIDDGFYGAFHEDIINEIKEKCRINLVSEKQFIENTENMKKEVVNVVDFLNKNRDKSKDWFWNHYLESHNIFSTQDDNTFNFCPDKKGILLSSLTFSDDGKTLLEVGELSEDDVFEEVCINEYGESYKHDSIQTFFNEAIQNFNDVQKAANIVEKILGYPIHKRAEIIEAMHKYFNDKYGAGCDMTYSEVAEELVASNGIIGLAYTELGDKNQFPVQVNFDFNENKYKYDLGGYDVTALTLQLDYNSMGIDAFIDDMNWCDFDDMIHDHYGILEQIYGENWESARFDESKIEAVLKKVEKSACSKGKEVAKEALDTAKGGSGKQVVRDSEER